MDEKENNGPKLRLIQGGLHSKISVGPVQIFVGPENMPPYPVDALVAEEDTFLVLSADPEVFASDENPVRVITGAYETSPEKPGSVVVKNGHPLQLLAIVHDLNQEPSWKEEWVVSALDGIFREVENRQLKSIALPLIGSLHGALEKKRFLALLREALEGRAFHHLNRLWLVVPAGTASEILKTLRSQLEI